MTAQCGKTEVHSDLPVKAWSSERHSVMGTSSEEHATGFNGTFLL